MENSGIELSVRSCPSCGVKSIYKVAATADSCFFRNAKLSLFLCSNAGCGHYAWFNLQIDELMGNGSNYLCIEGLRSQFELPPQMVSDFKEALGCYTHGYYNASVVMARRLLEQILLGKGAKPGQRICDMIKDLANRGIIDHRLKGLCDEIKFLGNIGAHANEEQANESDAQTALHFSDFLVSWLFGRTEDK